ncbi:hypothetical protein UT300005_04240 [Clostridium sp. CTA-5]
MKSLQFKDGLLYTSITLKHGDKSVLVDDVIIVKETWNAKSLLNSKITRIDIIESIREWKAIYSQINTNEINNKYYANDLAGIGIDTETGYIRV